MLNELPDWVRLAFGGVVRVVSRLFRRRKPRSVRPALVELDTEVSWGKFVVRHRYRRDDRASS